MRIVAVPVSDIKAGDILTEGVVFAVEENQYGQKVFTFALGQSHANPGAKVLRYGHVPESQRRALAQNLRVTG